MVEAASVEDLMSIVQLKLAMFEESGHSDLLTDQAASLIYEMYRSLYADAKACHFIVRKQDEIVACAGGFLKDDLPYCFAKVPYYGFIGDVYTRPEHRRKGYAKLLTSQTIAWLKDQGAREIRLLATGKGRPIYEKLGFHSTDEMVLSI